jgi:quinol monooxygenase YgiN
MWAQIIKSRLKAGADEEFRRVNEDIGALAVQRSGWVRSLVLRDQNDPQQIYSVVVFESEEKARATEQTPETQEIVARVRAVMDGMPEYVDCEVVSDQSP